MNNSRLIIAAILLGLAGCGQQSETPPLAGAAIGGPFTLTSENGQPVKSSSFDGKYRLIYFGYTFCPDVCPMDTQLLMKGYQLFAKQDAARAAEIVPLFITLDPARDTPAVLKEWTDAFDPHLIGLTGTPAQIDAVAKQFAIFFSRNKPDADGAYLVDHARMALLMGKKGEPVALITQDKDAQTVAAELDRWVR
jgi:protein SCO1